MSKISFTIALPHDGPDGNRTPQFFLSTSNNTFLSFKGADWRGARLANSNATGGWKNRFEYSVVAAKGITKFSVQMNTSVILPPLSWGLPGLPVKAKGKEQEKGRERERERDRDREKIKPREKGSSRGSSSLKSSSSPSKSSSKLSSKSSSSSSASTSRDSTPPRKSYDSRESSRRSERRYEQPKLKTSASHRRLRDLEEAAYGSKRRHRSRRDESPGIVVDYYDY